MQTNHINKEYVKYISKMNTSFLEENGYWYSEDSDSWFQKVYRSDADNPFKDKSIKCFGWDLIKDKDAIESLNLGFLPNDLDPVSEVAPRFTKEENTYFDYLDKKYAHIKPVDTKNPELPYEPEE